MKIQSPSRPGVCRPFSSIVLLALVPLGAVSLAAHAADEPAAPAANEAPIQSIEITAKRLDEARNGLSPETGSSVYKFSESDIGSLPLGENTPLNQVILQAPGVVQDSYGQLHVRGDHANLQYRVNGVVIPEAISGFGQSLNTRFVDELSILTGALPAQYGYRTAGVVDIHTKGDHFDRGGNIALTGGSHADREIAADFSDSVGALSYFGTASYLQNNLGIENPTSDRNALHDTTRQANGFGLLSYVLDDSSRLTAMAGVSDNRFQIPDVRGQDPSFTLAGAGPIDSSTLNANQREKNRFEIVSYQKKVGDVVDYQFSLFHRYTDVKYEPDPIGDLVFNGVAANILRSNDAYGAQGDLSVHAGATHTVRAGLFVSRERFTTRTTSLVFPADDAGNQTNTSAISIADNTLLKGGLFGVYVQDEWQPLDSLTINYGARYDKTTTVVDETQVSPRIGLVYNLSEQTAVHFGYARYFTPPPTEIIDTTSIAKFLNTTNALPSDANTSVKSERSDYYDAGLSYKLNPQVTLGADGYYRDVRHLQDEGQFGNALIFSAFNYERGKIYGVELSGTYRSEHLNAYANVSHSLARGRGLESGQFNFGQDEIDFINTHWVHLDHDQTLSASGGISYVWKATTLGGDLLFGSGLRNDFANSGHLPSYTQLNASVTQRLHIGGQSLDLRFALINLLDRTYALRDGSGIGVGAPQFGPRRALYIAASKDF